MDLFTIDTVGASSSSSSGPSLLPSTPRYRSTLTSIDSSSKTPSRAAPAQEDSDDDDDYGGLPPPSKDIFEILSADEPHAAELSFREDRGTSFVNPRKRKVVVGKNPVQELAATDVAGCMRAAVVTPATEKQQDLATLSMTERKIRELNRKERSKTKGRNWFNLPAPELTEETKNELELIRMRSILDPKHFYKRSEMKTLPKYFQVGKVVASPLEYYNERTVKKSKAKTLVDELLADAEFQRYNKRKYAEALEKRKKKAYVKATKKMKKVT